MTEQEKQEIRERSESVHETWWIDHPGTVAKLLCHDIPRLLDALDERDNEINRLKQVVRDAMKFLEDHSGTVDYPRKLTLEELEELYGFMKTNLRTN